MPLRVVSGTAKGRRLKDVPGDTTRPVTDMVKQALFNIISSDVLESAWWDLFGGTGAIGIEAISRGAAFVRFSELDRTAVETIKANLKTTEFTSRAEVRRGDAFAMLGNRADRQFDYVYIAPPQYKHMWSKALTLVDEHQDWLSDGAWVIVQIHPKENEEIQLKNLRRIDLRQYGSTLLIIYEKVVDDITNSVSSVDHIPNGGDS